MSELHALPQERLFALSKEQYRNLFVTGQKFVVSGSDALKLRGWIVDDRQERGAWGTRIHPGSILTCAGVKMTSADTPRVLWLDRHGFMFANECIVAEVQTLEDEAYSIPARHLLTPVYSDEDDFPEPEDNPGFWQSTIVTHVITPTQPSQEILARLCSSAMQGSGIIVYSEPALGSPSEISLGAVEELREIVAESIKEREGV